jgi:hypothetical protein
MTTASPSVLGDPCACGRMPTTRQMSPLDFADLYKNVPWSPHLVVDLYCEACYVYHCWDHKQTYIPLGDEEGFELEDEAHMTEIESYVLSLYEAGKLPMPEPLPPQVRSYATRSREILTLLTFTPGLSSRELAHEMGFRNSKCVQKHLSRMVRDGMIHGGRDDVDRRRITYHICGGGNSCADQVS